MKREYYLQTWFIAIVAAFGFLIVPAIIAIVLIIRQYLLDKKLVVKYGAIDELDSKQQEYSQRLSSLEQEISNHQILLLRQKNSNQEELEKQKNINQEEFEKQKKSISMEIQQLKNELKLLNEECIIQNYNFSDYSSLTSEDCKNKLSVLKIKETELIKDEDALSITSTDSNKIINNNKKQILRCFNTECDNILLNISIKNIDSMRSKITKAYETLNKIFETDGVTLTKEFLEIKLEELNLVYTYELKRQQEIELQKAIKEQMVEEEKVRREIEKQKAIIEKDMTQFRNEVNKLISYLQKTENDTEKQLYLDKINELEEKLKVLEIEKENVLEREANAKAGFVYIISNIGSFGDDVYKIGMTRRLEPMDRIKELSSASVPFEFDVHAMIFSDDAPALESALHKKFEKNSVNKVNPRKEFFKVSLDEIEQCVISNYNNTVAFTKIPLARDYRESLAMNAS